MSLLKHIQPTLASLAFFTLLFGGAYPLATLAITQTAFHSQAEGSLIRNGNTVIGSSLIGQNFTQPQYLWGRLSATGPAPFNAGASSGSNYGVNNPALIEAATARREAMGVSGPVPVDLITASGSGLDPHISPAAADLQVPRIAQARGLSEAKVRSAIEASTEQPTLGLLGEPRVNVLQVNLRLDGKQK
ncbi:K+-transporting ATPase, C subunit [Asticcacaulis biprosthecium C19]|uniref:Potassium-transporting ATPase KdpC subunit n=1 Tax=Asticcacaulis biprosthecium C19 TaxID=715226 RepID=F4QPW4_9CAUL|nr:potassium-transporting ATPase subunit KdpC [Asticcacaulis biprosthecium]EGF90251.1 K+-transporting ATPase, C subunit [Asticcacaulis biprosthecium C19]